MHFQPDKSHRMDDIKTQFRAREGYYRLMNSPDYSQRSQRAMGFSSGTASSNSSTATHEKAFIKISLVTIRDRTIDNTVESIQSRHSIRSNKSHRRSRGISDMKICFNVGRELFVYNYDGVRTGPDASNPIYKRFYKGSSPTCHDFNHTTALTGSIKLLVGFVHGQAQLIDLNDCDDQDACKEFNSDRLIDKTRVTCIKWLPNSSSLFLVAHASGQLYLYKDDLPCGPTAPTYQIHKQSGGVTIYTCKTKTTRNPLYRWSIGNQTNPAELNGLNTTFGTSSNSLFKFDNESRAVNEFVFSPCAKYLACASQDGFLRVFCYDTMELIGRARSYYGGLTCVCWSPDGKYVITGGEDDLITIWSFIERRVVARGLGHKSWVSVVAFDSFYNGRDINHSDIDNYDEDDDDEDKELDSHDIDDDEDVDDMMDNFDSITKLDQTDSPAVRTNSNHNNNNNNYNSSSATHARNTKVRTYRFGSVGQDTQLCLWDLSDDLLQQAVPKTRPQQQNGSSSLDNLTSAGLDTGHTVGEANQACGNTHSVNNHEQAAGPNSGANTTKEVDSQTNNTATSKLLPSKSGAFTKTFSLVGKRDKRYFLKGSDKNHTNSRGIGPTSVSGDKLVDDPAKLLGSPICPRMREVPLIEPTVCKKISIERLTSLIFCRGGFITSCQDGFVFSWARPSRKSMNTSPSHSTEELRVIDVGTSSAV